MASSRVALATSTAREMKDFSLSKVAYKVLTVSLSFFDLVNIMLKGFHLVTSIGGIMLETISSTGHLGHQL